MLSLKGKHPHGQYSHRVGIGHMVTDLGQPGYKGRLSENAATIAEVLKPSGYRTFMSGKWHVGTNDPTRHGFEQYYGTLISAATFWDPAEYLRLPQGNRPRSYARDGFYGTDALTDHALDFIEEARRTPDRPWFVYLAYNAPHFPLHARREDIVKYRNRYAGGWDVLRDERLVKMKRLGLVSGRTRLSLRSTFTNYGETQTAVNPAWNSLPEDRRVDLAMRMAIYAAMVDRMDQNIGRVIADVRVKGEFENTLILFLSDNGACAEWDPFGFDIRSSANNFLHRDAELEQMGSPGSYHSIGSGWANASNTPWRMYKHYSHEGGISTPCIVHWPAGVRKRNGIDNTPVHLIDLMPTIVEASEATYPQRLGDREILPMAGVSLLPLLRGGRMPDRALYFEHEGTRAVREGRYKLTALRGESWKLYDMDRDRTEMEDMAEAGFDSPGKERLHALGAIDLALWDIKGKALKAPLYELFGGQARQHIELYATNGVPPGPIPQNDLQRMSLKEHASATMAAGYRVYRVDSAIAPSPAAGGGGAVVAVARVAMAHAAVPLQPRL